MLAILAAFVAYLIVTGKLGDYLKFATQGSAGNPFAAQWTPNKTLQAPPGTNPASVGTEAPKVGEKTSPNVLMQPDTLEKLGVTPWGFR